MLRKILTAFSALMIAMGISSSASAQAPSEIKEPQEPYTFDLSKTYKAYIETDKGLIVCQLDPEKAPLSVTNFMQLASNGFYNGLTFHRVVPNFVVQGGDPDGTGRGGPGYTVAQEISLPHHKGALAWARLPDHVNPEKRSSGSQFYITLEPTPFLDGEYTVFGYMLEGNDVLPLISQGDHIQKVTVSAE